jgi:hypothetical protein
MLLNLLNWKIKNYDKLFDYPFIKYLADDFGLIIFDSSLINRKIWKCLTKMNLPYSHKSPNHLKSNQSLSPNYKTRTKIPAQANPTLLMLLKN